MRNVPLGPIKEDTWSSGTPAARPAAGFPKEHLPEGEPGVLGGAALPAVQAPGTSSTLGSLQDQASVISQPGFQVLPSPCEGRGLKPGGFPCGVPGLWKAKRGACTGL